MKARGRTLVQLQQTMCATDPQRMTVRRLAVGVCTGCCVSESVVHGVSAMIVPYLGIPGAQCGRIPSTEGLKDSLLTLRASPHSINQAQVGFALGSVLLHMQGGGSHSHSHAGLHVICPKQKSTATILQMCFLKA